MQQRILHGSVFAAALIVGCGGQSLPSKADLKKRAGGELKEVVPVSGIVTIDGSPELGVNIYFHASNGNAPVAKARTDAAGKFCLSTYVKCDGIEPGDYKLTFKHIETEKERGDSEDLLKEKYSSPEKSTFSLTVEKGKPQKDLKYDLTQD